MGIKLRNNELGADLTSKFESTVKRREVKIANDDLQITAESIRMPVILSVPLERLYLDIKQPEQFRSRSLRLLHIPTSEHERQ